MFGLESVGSLALLLSFCLADQVLGKSIENPEDDSVVSHLGKP